MMSNADRRLNQVEDDLETVKQLLVSTARRVESNSEAIDRLTERMDRLAESQQVTQNSIDRLAGLVVRLVENAEADRAAIRGIQTENQRILEYLFGQQRGLEN